MVDARQAIPGITLKGYLPARLAPVEKSAGAFFVSGSLYARVMPNVLHIWCRCGRYGRIEVNMKDDHHQTVRQVCCGAYGETGAAPEFRLGWVDDLNCQRHLEDQR